MIDELSRSMDGCVQTIGGVQGHLPKPAVLVTTHAAQIRSLLNTSSVQYSNYLYACIHVFNL